MTLNSLPSRPGPHPHPSYGTGSAIGRLEIPRHWPFRGRAGRAAIPTRCVWAWDGWGIPPLPSEAGNVVLAGHRDTFFRSLGEIRKGDRHLFAYTGGNLSLYRRLDIRGRTHGSGVIMPTRRTGLTLVTCYPFYYVGRRPATLHRARAARRRGGRCPPSAPVLSPRRRRVTGAQPHIRPASLGYSTVTLRPRPPRPVSPGDKR